MLQPHGQRTRILVRHQIAGLAVGEHFLHALHVGTNAAAAAGHRLDQAQSEPFVMC